MKITVILLPTDAELDDSSNSVFVIIIADRPKIIGCEPPLGKIFLFLHWFLPMLLRMNIFCISVFVIVSGCHIPIESGHVLHSQCQNRSTQD